jgi:ABC-type methionine transport system ATPase subunit
LVSPKIRVHGLRYAVGGAEILRGVDAEVPDGRITAVVGPSGAGKSTFLRAVNRLIEPTAGEVYLDGEPTDGMDLLELRRRVGMVFQLPALFGRSVEDAILYGARLAGRDADAPRLLEMVGLDRSLAAREPENLSVGQQQRVSIARALALEPEVEDLARGLNARLGLTMVFVSHDLAQVERVADRVILLAGGESRGAWERDDFFSGAGERARRLLSGRL